MIGWEIVEIVVIGFLQMSRRECIDCSSAPVIDEDNLRKLFFQFEQIHFGIWTYTFLNLDKYNLQFGQIHFGILYMGSVDGFGCR